LVQAQDLKTPDEKEALLENRFGAEPLPQGHAEEEEEEGSQPPHP
jgi:hypothetical protein